MSDIRALSSWGTYYKSNQQARALLVNHHFVLHYFPYILSYFYTTEQQLQLIKTSVLSWRRIFLFDSTHITRYTPSTAIQCTT
jgi:hypothetical protein